MAENRKKKTTFKKLKVFFKQKEIKFGGKFKSDSFKHRTNL